MMKDRGFNKQISYTITVVASMAIGFLVAYYWFWNIQRKSTIQYREDNGLKKIDSIYRLITVGPLVIQANKDFSSFVIARSNGNAIVVEVQEAGTVSSDYYGPSTSSTANAICSIGANTSTGRIDNILYMINDKSTKCEYNYYDANADGRWDSLVVLHKDSGGSITNSQKLPGHLITAFNSAISNLCKSSSTNPDPVQGQTDDTETEDKPVKPAESEE